MTCFRSVDRLAQIEADLSRLRREAEKIRESLKERGPGEYAGQQFRAVVREYDRRFLDTAKMKGFLTPDEIIAASVSKHCVALTVRPLAS